MNCGLIQLPQSISLSISKKKNKKLLTLNEKCSYRVLDIPNVYSSLKQITVKYVLDRFNDKIYFRNNEGCWLPLSVNKLPLKLDYELFGNNIEYRKAVYESLPNNTLITFDDILIYQKINNEMILVDAPNNNKLNNLSKETRFKILND